MSRRKRKNHSQFSLFVFQDIITCVMGIMLLLTLMMCLQITSVIAATEHSAASQMVDELRSQAAALSAEVGELQAATDKQATLLNSGAIDNPELLRDRSLTLKNDNQQAKTDINGLWKQVVLDDATLNRIKDAKVQQSSQIQETQALIHDNERLKEKVSQLQSGDRIVYNGHDGRSQTCWLVELTDGHTFQAAELGKLQPPTGFKSRQTVTNWIEQQHRTGAVFLLLVKPLAADILDPLTEDLRKSHVVFGFDLLPQDRSAIDPLTGAGVQ